MCESRKSEWTVYLGATVLGRVKRWRLAMLALRAARGSGAAASARGAFDPPCAPRLFDLVGTKGVPLIFDPASGGSNKGLLSPPRNPYFFVPPAEEMDCIVCPSYACC
jgi:hypothetical protein